MNPTQEQLNEMWQDYQARQIQQIKYPLDEASRNSLGAAIGNGPGSSALTQNISIGAGGGTAAVPKAYQGTVLLLVDGITYEIGYLRTV